MLGLSPRITNHHFLIEPFCSDWVFQQVNQMWASWWHYLLYRTSSRLHCTPNFPCIMDWNPPFKTRTRRLRIAIHLAIILYSSLALLEFLPCPYSGLFPLPLPFLFLTTTLQGCSVSRAGSSSVSVWPIGEVLALLDRDWVLIPATVAFNTLTSSERALTYSHRLLMSLSEHWRQLTGLQ